MYDTRLPVHFTVNEFQIYFLPEVASSKIVREPTSELQKPQLNVSDVYFNVGERINVSCDIKSYPSSKVLWSFTPCEEVDISVLCDESRRVAFNVIITLNFKWFTFRLFKNNSFASLSYN